MHTFDDEGTKTVTVTVSDTTDGQTDSQTFQVDVSDPPVLPSGSFTIMAARGAPFFSQTVATFTDPGGAEPKPGDPMGIESHYAADIAWGDGTTSAGTITYVGNPGSPTSVFTVQGDHTYTTNGDYTITVTIHHDSAPAARTASQATVLAVVNHAQGCCDDNSLVIGASMQGDTIRVIPQGAQNGALSDVVQVLINGFSQGTFTGFNKIAIFGQDGDDDFEIVGAVKKDACLYGGKGNDRLKGGSGNNVLVGGDGNDQLNDATSSGRSLLIGGKGSDRLVGGGDADILIGDYTDFDDPRGVDNMERLCTLHDLWKESQAGYDIRTAAVLAFLKSSAVNAPRLGDDGSADMLTGGSERDLFFLGIGDTITNRKKDEQCFIS
jgi:Ca2+-binding RTX toxin-like protein